VKLCSRGQDLNVQFESKYSGILGEGVRLKDQSTWLKDGLSSSPTLRNANTNSRVIRAEDLSFLKAQPPPDFTDQLI
jgi:hypothetical protein